MNITQLELDFLRRSGRNNRQRMFQHYKHLLDTGCIPRERHGAEDGSKKTTVPRSSVTKEHMYREISAYLQKKRDPQLEKTAWVDTDELAILMDRFHLESPTSKRTPPADSDAVRHLRVDLGPLAYSSTSAPARERGVVAFGWHVLAPVASGRDDATGAARTTLPGDASAGGPRLEARHAWQCTAQELRRHLCYVDEAGQWFGSDRARALDKSDLSPGVRRVDMVHMGEYVLDIQKHRCTCNSWIFRQTGTHNCKHLMSIVPPVRGVKFLKQPQSIQLISDHVPKRWNPLDWVFSTKYDGIRVLCKGKTMFTRGQKDGKMQLDMTMLPREHRIETDLVLDGELCAHSDTLRLGHDFVLRCILSGNMSQLRVRVIDVVDQRLPFEERCHVLSLLQLPPALRETFGRWSAGDVARSDVDARWRETMPRGDSCPGDSRTTLEECLEISRTIPLHVYTHDYVRSSTWLSPRHCVTYEPIRSIGHLASTLGTLRPKIENGAMEGLVFRNKREQYKMNKRSSQSAFKVKLSSLGTLEKMLSSHTDAVVRRR